MEQADEIGLGVLENLVEHFRAVAHLHHRHSRALIVGDLGARTLQHL